MPLDEQACHDVAMMLTAELGIERAREVVAALRQGPPYDASVTVTLGRIAAALGAPAANEDRTQDS